MFVYLPFCMCLEKAAKTRLALVKAHGLQLLKSLQSRAKHTWSCMQKLTEEHYLAEMKRYSIRKDSGVQVIDGWFTIRDRSIQVIFTDQV